MKDVVLAEDDDSIKAYSLLVDSLEKVVYKDFGIINDLFLGNREDYEIALEVFTAWKPIRNEVFSLMSERQIDKAVDITRGKGARHVEKIEKAMEEVGDFAQHKARDFLHTAEITKSTAFNLMYFLIGFSVLVAALLAYLITKSITNPIITLKKATEKIGKGELDNLIDIKSKDEFGHLADSFNKMTVDLNEITTSRDNLNREIEERKKTEKELRESEARYEDLYDNAPDMFVSVDAKTAKILRCNQTLVKALGYSTDEIINQPIYFVYHPNSIEDAKKAFKSFTETGKVQNKELQLKRKDGSKIDVILNVSAVRDEQGNILYSRSVWRDNTLRKRAEEELEKHRNQLKEMVEEQTKELKETYMELNKEVEEKLNYQAEAFRSAKLASIGELAAGVAHEINNPINGIINYAQMLVNKYELESKDHNVAKMIMKESDRIANIVACLLSLSRTTDKKKSLLKINDVIADIIALNGAQLRKDGIALTVDMPEDLPLLNANFNQLQQVFLNILTNARYAINEKYPNYNENKIIKIKGEKAAVENTTIVRLTLFDSGVGIPYDILNKIMNPFFTTKPAKQGTGLGLSISHGIISDHGGKLQIDSVYGEFTKVIIDLPVHIIYA
jgi:PAS domain S-box-containing protein